MAIPGRLLTHLPSKPIGRCISQSTEDDSPEICTQCKRKEVRPMSLLPSCAVIRRALALLAACAFCIPAAWAEPKKTLAAAAAPEGKIRRYYSCSRRSGLGLCG